MIFVTIADIQDMSPQMYLSEEFGAWKISKHRRPTRSLAGSPSFQTVAPCKSGNTVSPHSDCHDQKKPGQSMHLHTHIATAFGGSSPANFLGSKGMEHESLSRADIFRQIGAHLSSSGVAFYLFLQIPANSASCRNLHRDVVLEASAFLVASKK
jgi:hypothetical protein